MNTFTIIDEVIDALDPQDVPVEYIISVILDTTNETQVVLYGDDMRNFLKFPLGTNFTNAKIRLDVRKIRLAMLTAVNQFNTKLKLSGYNE